MLLPLLPELEPCLRVDRLPVLKAEYLVLIIIKSPPDHPINLISWEFVDFSAFHSDCKLLSL